MIRRDREFRDSERGVAMVWLATTLVLLLGVAGFGVDLGWLYLTASRTQRTVDSAAMAGVVHLPSDPSNADLDARHAARANGYDVCNPTSTGCADALTSAPLSDNELKVDLTTTVDSFFLSALGFDNFDVTRSATAEYIKPVPLGSPNRCFGQDPTGTYCPANVNDFWAAVSAPYTHKRDGDPYSTNCLTNSGQSSCASNNSMYARGGVYNGYYYAVEVDDSGGNVTNVKVNIYDAAFMDRPNYPNTETADEYFSPDPNDGVTTHFQLHWPDSTPNDPTDNLPIAGCDWTLSEDTSDDPGDYINEWQTLCQLNGVVSPGVYVLHVWSSGNGSGSNQYSIAADAGGGDDPRVYGINDMSIFSNNLTAASQLYLVEIDPVHAGSKLELQFFDAGDASGYSEMRVRDPHGNIPNCDWESYNHNQTSTTDSGSGPCEWVTTLADGTRVYNNEWIVAIIDIPDTYTCNGSDCFWYMELDLSQPNERTTWRARVIGNPVRLIP